MYKSNPVARIILLLLLLFVTTLPQIISSFDENIDPFAFSIAGLAVAYSRSGRITFYPYSPDLPFSWQEHANFVSIRVIPILLLIILNQVTKLSIWQLLFLPILGLFSLLLTYIVCKNLYKSKLTAVSFVLAFSYETTLARFIYIHYISIGYTFIWIFLIIWLKFIRSAKIKRSNALLLFVIFVATYFSYYAAEFIILSFLLATLLISLILRITRVKMLRRSLLTLSICFIIFFLYLDNVVYHYLKNVSLEKTQILNSYLKYVLTLLTGERREVHGFGVTVGNPLLKYVTLLQHVTISLFVIMYFLRFIREIKVRQHIKLSLEELAILSLFTVGFLQMLIYLPIGYLNYILLFWVSLLVTFFSLDEFKNSFKRLKREILGLIILLIISLSIIKFTLRISDDVSPHGYRLSSLMKETVSWLVLHITNGYIATDLRIAGQLFMMLAKMGRADCVYPYKLGNEVRYLYSYDHETPYKIFGRKKNAYLVLSYEFMRRSFRAGREWMYAPPLGNALLFLNHYSSFNKIYDDNYGVVYKYIPRYLFRK